MQIDPVVKYKLTGTLDPAQMGGLIRNLLDRMDVLESQMEKLHGKAARKDAVRGSKTSSKA